MRDKRVSHGAFRFWHYLRDRANKETWTAWPSQKTIALDIGCNEKSIPVWTKELLESGYLEAVKNRGQRHVNEYVLAPPKMDVRETPRTTKNGALDTPKTAVPRTTKNGGLSDNSIRVQGNDFNSSTRETENLYSSTRSVQPMRQLDLKLDPYLLEKLARRRSLKEELFAGETSTAKRFAVLYQSRPDRARKLIGMAVNLPCQKNGQQPVPARWLNVALQNEGVRF